MTLTGSPPVQCEKDGGEAPGRKLSFADCENGRLDCIQKHSLASTSSVWVEMHRTSIPTIFN